MKKITLSALAVLTLAFTITSCKKGENDPAISLKSRKARVANEWVVSSYAENSANSNTSPNSGPNNTVVNTTNSSTNDETHDGTNLTVVTSGSYQYYNSGTNSTTTTTSSSTILGKVAEHSFTFDKDGTWSSVNQYTTTETITTNSGNQIEVREKTYDIKSSGVWNFLGKIGDAKNKESMVVSTLKSDSKITTVSNTTFVNSPSLSYKSTNVSNGSNTYVVNENANIWKITQLKSKEMLVEGTFDNTYTTTNTSENASTSGGTTVTSTSTSTNSGTSKGAVKMTLTQK